MSSVSISGYLALGLGNSGVPFAEVSGAGYGRNAVTLVTPDGVTLVNSAGATFGPDLAGDWGLVTCMALFDASTGGNMLMVWPIRLPAYAAASRTFTVTAGAIQLVVRRLLSAITDSIFTNFPAAAVLGTCGQASVVAGVALTAGQWLLQALVSNTLQATNNLGDLANPALARVNINRGDLALTYATAIATDGNTGNVFHILLTGNALLSAPVNLRAGASYIWRIVQDSVGGRTITFAPCFKFPSGSSPVLTPTAGATDILSALSDGTNVYAVIMKDMR